VQEAMTDVEPTAWAMKHVFTTGTIVQMFRLAPAVLSSPVDCCQTQGY